jgi:hypothetical protein
MSIGNWQIPDWPEDLELDILREQAEVQLLKARGERKSLDQIKSEIKGDDMSSQVEFFMEATTPHRLIVSQEGTRYEGQILLNSLSGVVTEKFRGSTEEEVIGKATVWLENPDNREVALKELRFVARFDLG